MLTTKWVVYLGVFCAVVGIANAEVGQQLRAKGNGNSSFIDDFTTVLPPHLRVSFVLTEMSHEAVSGGGVQVTAFTEWFVDSNASTEEYSGSLVYLPPPDSVQPESRLIYDALVIDGCGNTPVFPISFDNWIVEEKAVENPVIGEFSATDNSTIQPNGFWTFSYTIHATDSFGGVSDYTFRGTVSATCTNLYSFD
jgi:hypothetical protein